MNSRRCCRADTHFARKGNRRRQGRVGGTNNPEHRDGHQAAQDPSNHHNFPRRTVRQAWVG